jgi:cell division GTPase FtsZ
VIDDYLARLARGMQADRAGRAAVLDEVRDHLLEVAADQETRGIASERALHRAVARAVTRFGPPEQLRAHFAPHGGWGPAPRRILAVGVGDVGARVVADLVRAPGPRFDTLAVDIHPAALDHIPIDRKLTLGFDDGAPPPRPVSLSDSVPLSDSADSSSASRRPLHSSHSPTAESDAAAVRASLSAPEVVVIVAALDDPAGAAAAPFVARIAAATGALTVAAAIRPAGDPMSDLLLAARVAEGGLFFYADAVIVLDELRLLVPLVQSRHSQWSGRYRTVDEGAVAVVDPTVGWAVEPAVMARVRTLSTAALRRAAEAILRLSRAQPGIETTSDPRVLLAGAGVLSFGIGRAEGVDAIADATRAAFASPSIELQRRGLGRVLCCLSGSGLHLGRARHATGTIADIVGEQAGIVVTVTASDSSGETRSIVLAGRSAPPSAGA